nr:NADP-dependent glyceraldehyde-3-phosphate dehydrogenase [Lactococcus insecticola]
MTTYQYYVGGKFVNSTSGNLIDIECPYEDRVIGRVQAISKEEADAAIAATKSAQIAWADTDLFKRAELLNKWADQLEIDAKDIAQIIMQEVGKTWNDALKEVTRTADFIRYTVQEFIHTNDSSMSGENYPGGSKNKFAIIKRIPLGTILAISPFNYPVNLSVAKLAPALISGNAVVFKPATQGAISAVKIIESFDKVGFPADVLQLITGKGSDIGDYVSEHEGIDMISFTGGATTGRHLSSFSTMKPMVLELGGKDPAIVCADADIDKAVAEIMSGAYSYSGQRCTAIKRVLVNDAVADDLVARLKTEVEALTVGMPIDNPVIVPLINKGSADYVADLIADTIAVGADLLVGNKREGNLIYPTLFDHVTTDMRLAWEEPFGPVLPIIRVASDEEAIKIANASEYGLQASVFSENFSRAVAIAGKIEAGSVQINGRTERGPDHFPFLGVKNSGMGVHGIAKTIDAMTREKLIVVNL